MPRLKCNNQTSALWKFYIGECGSRGEFIHLTPNYLINLNDSSEETIGPHNNTFVHEWAKLKYGVFEEFGYPGDDQFPLFYWQENYVDGGQEYELKPNFCTDFDLKGFRE